jgi:metal-responsive CopG/Arc/MetJ family transcriptional regulator
MSYFGRMKIKTSITLESDILAAVDRLARASNRSQVVETALREYLGRLERERRDALDREILDRVAAELDEEMADVLAYQTAR